MPTTVLAVIGGCFGVACAGAKPAPVPNARLLPPAALAAPAPPSIPQYRLLAREGERNPMQALIAGLRFVQAQDGTVQSASSVAATPLTGGRRVPDDAGGGFVFWGGSAVYRSSSFLAPLEPLASATWQVSDVAFGPGFWLLLSSGGQRTAVDLTGAARAIEPAGLIDIEAASDGRVVGLLELGRAIVSSDGGAHYREVQAELGGNASKLSRNPLGFVMSGDAVVGLEPGGKLVRLPKEHPKPGVDIEGIVRSPFVVTLSQLRAQKATNELTAAIGEGVLVAPGQALVALDAALVRVDLLTGQVLSRTQQLVPGAQACQVIRLGRELLMICKVGSDLALVGGLEQDKPRLERILQGHSDYSVAAGQLLIDGACTGDAPYSVCVRSEGAEWRSLRCPILEPQAAVSGAPSAAAPPTPAPSKKPGPNPATAPGPHLTGFIAREGGGVVALVGEPVNGYVDLLSGRTVKLESGFSEVASAHPQCIIDGSGSLRCLGSRYSLAFDRDGKPEPRFQFTDSKLAPGGRALAWTDKSHLFQTNDYGRSWTEVAAPAARATPQRFAGACSEVGCIFDGWMRTGWDIVKPEPREPPDVAPQPAEPVSTLPRVVCRSAEPPKLPAPPRATYDDSDSDAAKTWGLGLQQLPSDDFVNPLLLGTPAQAKAADTSAPDRGVAFGFTRERPDPHQKGSTITEASPLTFRYVAHFDPSASPTTASLSFEQLLSAARRLRQSDPDSSVLQAGSLGLTPVLGSTAGSAAGFIVTFEGAVVWVNGTRTLALDPPPNGYSVLSALLLPRQELAVLYDDSEGRSRIFRYGSDGRGVAIGETPYDPPRAEPTPDALALSPGGKPAILRFPSTQRPPTPSDPAFAYVPGEPLTQLAAWSTLTAASDPACQNGAGYRAIVATPVSWLSVSRDASEPGDDWGTLALVRWSAERVCLEAVEGAADNFSQNDGDIPTRIVWSLTPKPRAARVGFSGGFELRQAQNCQLLPAPPPAAPPAGLLRRPREP